MTDELSPRALAYEKIRELAKTRLLEMEDNLKEKGYRSRAGVEVEFFVRDDEHNPIKLKKEDFDRLKERLGGSRYVERVYQEGRQFQNMGGMLAAWGGFLGVSAADPVGAVFMGGLGYGMGRGIQRWLNGTHQKIAQYELVLGDKQNVKDVPDSINRNRMNAFKGAVAAEHMKYVIEEELAHIGCVDYSPRSDDGRVVSGLHLNMSLIDKEGKNPYADTHLLEQSTRHLVELQKEGTLLMLPSEDALSRLDFGRSAPQQFGYGRNKQRIFGKSGSAEIRNPSVIADTINWRSTSPQSSRTENRLPGANADPYLSAIVSVGAMIDGLEARQDIPKKKYPLPENMGEMLETFQNSGKMKKLLGEELHKAVVNYVHDYGDLSIPPDFPVEPMSRFLYAGKQYTERNR